MKALVTGASGFIGSTLIEELGTLGFEVYALMRRTSSSANLEGLKYQRMDGDILNPESLKKAVQGMDYVFHLAGVTVAANRKGFFNFNTQGTKNLADAVAEFNPTLSRFVYVSSLAAGGPADQKVPRNETEDPRPVSAYGESKLQGEIELLRHKDIFPVSIVRPPMVYGPKDKATFVFVQTVARNLMPVIPGSGPDRQKHYSVIHVRDLVRGIVQAGVQKNLRTGEIFYLTGDEDVTYEGLMTAIADRLNRDPLKIKIPIGGMKVAALTLSFVGKFIKKTFPLNRDKYNEMVPDYWLCSNEKAKKMLGFVPQYDFKTGIAQTIDWYQRQRWI